MKKIPLQKFMVLVTLNIGFILHANLKLYLLKNSQAVKKWCGLKKQSWEIKGSGQEWLQCC